MSRRLGSMTSLQRGDDSRIVFRGGNCRIRRTMTMFWSENGQSGRLIRTNRSWMKSGGRSVHYLYGPQNRTNRVLPGASLLYYHH